MALTVENSNLVWQKVKVSLDALGASPVAQAAFRALKERLAGVGGNPDLEFKAIDASVIDDASGSVLCTDPCKVYAVYGKKTATATDAYLAILDDATDDTGVATDVRIVLPFILASDEVFSINVTGFTHGTGVVAKTYTDWDGTTDSTAGDSPNGFAILGAA